MKANSVIETSIVGDQLALKFSNGAELFVDPAVLSESIKQSAMLHGFKQKLCDAAAMSRDPETGKPATVEMKYAAVKEVYDRLFSGEWNATREGGGSTGGLLYRALCQIYAASKTPEEIKVWLDAKTDAERKALRESKKIAKVIDSLRPVDKKAAAIDADALLADLR
jgi:hypothetical protein